MTVATFQRRLDDYVDKPISVLLASQFSVVRLGVITYLKDCLDIVCQHQVESLQQVAEQLTHANADVAIIDLSLLKPSGLADLRLLIKQDPGLKVIVLSRSEKEPFITQCMDNGALGYLSLKCTQAELIEAIRTVYRNEKYLSQDVAYGYAMASLNKTESALSSLTAREYQVFTLLAKGSAVAEIAKALFISPKTVHVYRANIFFKLGLSGVFELTLLALRHGVISIDVLES